MAMVDMEPPKPAQPSLELEPGANAYSGTAAPATASVRVGLRCDVDAGRPETALDRLHTYCMKKFAYLLQKASPETKPATTLNARVGQYLNSAKRNAKTIHPVSFKIMTGAVETFELFNGVRNDRSLAHDNRLIDRAEARFIFDGIVNFLRFIKATDAD